MSRDQCESVASSVESLLRDAQRVQAQCRQRSDQLARAADELSAESGALRQRGEAAQLEMARVRLQLEQLSGAMAAFEARERQARKLSTQL